MNLKEYRSYKGLTQPQLAEELKKVEEGIDAPLISKIEKGLVEPSDKIKAYIESEIDKSFEGYVRKPTQRDRVLDYIRRFGSITSWDAYADLGITQLGTRIFELKEMGYHFDKEYESRKNRFGKPVSYARYTLKEK